jgi:hypothetical protein
LLAGSLGFAASMMSWMETSAIGTKRSGSKLSLAYIAWFTTIGAGCVKSRVWPSAGALYTASAPMLPAAPERFSTVTGWPNLSRSLSATTRASRSVPPPGTNGTMIWIGFAG